MAFRNAARLLCIGMCIIGIVKSDEGGTEGVADVEGGDGQSQIKLLDMRRPLELTCNFTNAVAGFEIQWYKNEVRLEENNRTNIFANTSSLKILDPTKEDVGDYKCNVSGGLPQTPLVKTIKVIYLSIGRSPKSDTINEGMSLKLNCPVDGQPAPAVRWTMDGEPIEKKVNRTQLAYEDNDEGIINGRLFVHNIQGSQRGNYSCEINVEGLSYHRHTYIRVKGVYAALWPVLGIVVECALLGVVIIIFEKRRQKQDSDESDTDQGNDQKNRRK